MARKAIRYVITVSITLIYRHLNDIKIRLGLVLGSDISCPYILNYFAYKKSSDMSEKKMEIRHTTRMTTSISSEARRNQTSFLIRGRENHVSPKPDGQTYGRMDSIIYRVNVLLRIYVRCNGLIILKRLLITFLGSYFTLDLFNFSHHFLSNL